MKRYLYTSQVQLRRVFFEQFPELSRKRIKDHSGDGPMYATDTRCAFVNWIDSLERAGYISQDLAGRATL